MDSAPLTALITSCAAIIVATQRWVVSPWIKQRSAMIEALQRNTEAMTSMRDEMRAIRESVDALREFRSATVYRPRMEGTD